MAVDYAAVAAGMNQAIPFNSHVGLETATAAVNHGVVKLPSSPGARSRRRRALARTATR